MKIYKLSTAICGASFKFLADAHDKESIRNLTNVLIVQFIYLFAIRHSQIKVLSVAVLWLCSATVEFFALFFVESEKFTSQPLFVTQTLHPSIQF